MIRIPSRSRLFPEVNLLFDVWHDGVPWGVKIRSEPCTCGRPAGGHRHRYIEGGELHAGLTWALGSELRFTRIGTRIVVSGDLEG